MVSLSGLPGSHSLLMHPELPHTRDQVVNRVVGYGRTKFREVAAGFRVVALGCGPADCPTDLRGARLMPWNSESVKKRLGLSGGL